MIGITTSRVQFDDDHAAAVAEPYVEAVAAAGGLPIVLPVLSPLLAADVVASLDGLLLTGGGDVDPARYGALAVPEVYGVDERRDAWELALAQVGDIPVLGVCRGAQVLNVAAGGTLVQHIDGHRERERSRDDVHDVTLVPGSVLHAVLGSEVVGVNTLHHQAVAEVGTGVRVVATAADGTIEAIEGTANRRLLGVQWHPELLADRSAHAALFEWLIDAAATATTAATAIAVA